MAKKIKKSTDKKEVKAAAQKPKVKKVKETEGRLNLPDAKKGQSFKINSKVHEITEVTKTCVRYKNLETKEVFVDNDYFKRKEYKS